MAHAGGRPRKPLVFDPAQLPDREWLTVKEICEATGLYKETICARLQDGTLQGKKLGRQWKVYRDSLLNAKVEVDLNIEKR